MRLRDLPESTCATSGLSAFTLWKMGEHLTVDRIDSSLGYVKDNCQLMARALNLAKGAGAEVPLRSVQRLLNRALRFITSTYDQIPESLRQQIR